VEKVEGKRRAQPPGVDVRGILHRILAKVWLSSGVIDLLRSRYDSKMVLQQVQGATALRAC
jgi:hypothetical protein